MPDKSFTFKVLAKTLATVGTNIMTSFCLSGAHARENSIFIHVPQWWKPLAGCIGHGCRIRLARSPARFSGGADPVGSQIDDGGSPLIKRSEVLLTYRAGVLPLNLFKMMLGFFEQD